MSWSLVPQDPEHEIFLRDLFVLTKAQNFSVAGTVLPGFSDLVALQYEARNQDYRRRFPDAEWSTIVVDGALAGTLIVDEADSEWHVVDVALHPDFRGRGVGTELMGQVVARAAAAGKPIRLTVGLGNPARRLYERLGFVEIDNNGMDAVMRWEPE